MLWLKSALLPYLTYEIKLCAFQPTHAHFHTVMVYTKMPRLLLGTTCLQLVSSGPEAGS